jgi:hypothetical protein
MRGRKEMLQPETQQRLQPLSDFKSYEAVELSVKALIAIK